jgi:dipeptidyl aminopeptidase/acylaminoacyl peptidase
MLLLHGAEDSTVGVQNQTSLEAKVQEVGGKVETRIYDDTGHVKILMSLTPPLTQQTSALDDMDRFFKSQLSKKSGDS